MITYLPTCILAFKQTPFSMLYHCSQKNTGRLLKHPITSKPCVAYLNLGNAKLFILISNLINSILLTWHVVLRQYRYYCSNMWQLIIDLEQ